MTYHLVVGDNAFCIWLGCSAGQRIAKQAGVHTCDCGSRNDARDAARRLSPYFRVPVKAVRGPCPLAPALEQSQ